MPEHPAAVYVWPNGMVMAFDAEGKQMPDLQGPLEEVREKVAAACTEATHFPTGNWRNLESLPVDAKFFAREDHDA